MPTPAQPNCQLPFINAKHLKCISQINFLLAQVLSVIVKMSSGKHCIYAWITYFLMLYGLATFYFDVRTGRIQKSRVMSIYCRVLLLTIFCAFSYVILLDWKITPKIPTQSKLMDVLTYSQPAISFLSFIASLFCLQFGQHRIFEVIRDLLRVETLLAESATCVTPSQRPVLLGLYWSRLIIVLLRTAVLLLWIFTGVENYVYLLGISGSRIIMCGLYFLQFNIIWQICYTFFKLQLYLEQLLIDAMPMSRRVQKVLEVHRMYYKLIQMISKFCDIFKYSLGCYVLQLICNGCLSGYYFFRELVGNIEETRSRTMKVFLIIIMVMNALELSILANIANMASKLHDKTFHILRCSNLQSKQLERSV